MESQEGYQLPDLVKISELFLVPSSFLVAALGTADTNLHRASVSLLGLTVSVLWLVCAREALAEIVASKPEVIRTARIRIRSCPRIIAIAIPSWACRGVQTRGCCVLAIGIVI